MRDSERSQILEACDGIKSAADLMRFLMHVHQCRRREFPDDNPNSPRMLLAFSYGDLESKTGYSKRTLVRAVRLLKDRGFISLHNLIGQENLYQVNAESIARWLQKMPLFECQEFDVSPDGTGDILGVAPVPPCHRGVCHGGTGTSDTVSPVLLICAPVPPSAAAGEIADAEKETFSKDQTTADVLAHADDDQRPAKEAYDSVRTEIIDSYREVGIAQEHTEAYLASHSRQKLQASLECLRARSAISGHIRKPGGLLVSFLRDPTAWGYELDQHGCWRSSQEIARQKRLAARSRDRPVVQASPEVAAAVAWDRLSYAEQTKIRERIEAEHAKLSAGKRFELCRQEALNRSKYADDQAADDTRPEQGAPRPASGVATGGQ